MDIKKDIELFLKQSGWKQSELAKNANIHPVTLNRLLRGKRTGFNSVTLEKLWPFLYGEESEEAKAE